MSPAVVAAVHRGGQRLFSGGVCRMARVVFLYGRGRGAVHLRGMVLRCGPHLMKYRFCRRARCNVPIFSVSSNTPSDGSEWFSVGEQDKRC